MSWFEAATRLPIRVTQVAPAEDLAAPNIISSLNSGAVGALDTNSSLDHALADADLVYTDCWRRTTDPVEKQRIRDRYLPYQITAAHLSRLKPSALFLPCPPVTRGEEVSDDAMRSPLCQNYAAKNFLLHAQNAIMEHLALAGG
jgi:ornithine carbamoyltransferase